MAQSPEEHQLEELVLRANELAVAAAASQARLEAILASIGDAVLTIDETARIESANPAAERLFGRPTPQLIGTPIVDWVPGLDLSTLRPGAVTLQEAEARRADGQTVAVELSLNVLVRKLTDADRGPSCSWPRTASRCSSPRRLGPVKRSVADVAVREGRTRIVHRHADDSGAGQPGWRIRAAWTAPS